MKNIIIVIALLTSKILLSNAFPSADNNSDTIKQQPYWYRVITNVISPDTNFISNSFFRAKFDNCLLQRTIWKMNDFKSSVIYGGDFSNSNFFSDNFERASIEKADFTEVCFIGARLKTIDMAHITIKDSFFKKVLIRRTDMHEAKLHDSNFADANMSHVDLSKAFLENISFAGATLYKINFDGATFKEVDFSNAKISNFSISGALIFDKHLEKYRKMRVTDLIAAGAVVSMKDQFFNFF